MVLDSNPAVGSPVPGGTLINVRTVGKSQDGGQSGGGFFGGLTGGRN